MCIRLTFDIYSGGSQWRKVWRVKRIEGRGRDFAGTISPHKIGSEVYAHFRYIVIRSYYQGC